MILRKVNKYAKRLSKYRTKKRGNFYLYDDKDFNQDFRRPEMKPIFINQQNVADCRMICLLQSTALNSVVVRVVTYKVNGRKYEMQNVIVLLPYIT